MKTKIIVFYDATGEEFKDLFESVEELTISLKLAPTPDNLRRVKERVKNAVKRNQLFNYKGERVRVYKMNLDD